MSKRKIILLVISAILVCIIAIGTAIYLSKPELVNTGRVSFQQELHHENAARSVKFFPDNKWVATCSVDSSIKIWETGSGRLIKTFRQPQGITYIDISPDGSKLASTSYDGMMRVWDISSGQLLYSFPGSGRTVWCISFSPDGKLLAFAGEDSKIYIINVQDRKLIHTLTGHSKTVWSVKFSPDGQELSSGSFDQTLRTWNIHTGKIIRASMAHDQAIVDLAYSHNGKIIATTGDDKKIRLWKTADGSLIKTLEVAEHVQAVCFSPDDKMLLTGGRDKSNFGELIQNFAGESENIRGISARLWDIEKGIIIQTFSDHKNDVNDVAWSKDGKWLATASEDKTVHLWKVL